MNRIQQVLQKAEQDGTARRTQGTGESPSRRTAPPSVLVAPDHPLPRRVDVVDPPPAPPPAPIPGRVHLAPRPHPMLVAVTAHHSPAAERYRSLRTRIAQVERGVLRRTLMLTSPGRGDGKSLTTANLGVTMAQEFHRRVVIVDADLRQPSVHALLGLPPGPGLSDVLLGGATLEDVLVTLPEFNLSIVPAGRPPEQPTELLGSSAMRRVLEQLRGQFDRILIDTAPVAPLADAGVLVRLVDSVLLIVRANRTPRPAIERALVEVDTAKLLGLVLNDSAGPDVTDYWTPAADLDHVAPPGRRRTVARGGGPGPTA